MSGDDLPAEPSAMRVGDPFRIKESGKVQPEGLTGNGASGPKDQLNEESVDSKVCASGPADPRPDPPNLILPAHSVPRLPAHSDPETIVKEDGDLRMIPLKAGMSHPLMPKTPGQINEFAALWHNPDISVDKIARRYRCSERSIQNWRRRFKLGERASGRKPAAVAGTIAAAAKQIVSDVSEAMTVSGEILRAQAALGVQSGANPQALEGRALVLGPGGQIVDPLVMARSCNPLANEEIAALMLEVQAEARSITQHSDLSGLQRRLAKITILASTQMPIYTWESLCTILEALSRSILWTRKVEADIPQTGADPVLLRQEAGRQMMRELRQVLSEADQAALAVILKRGADAIMAAKGVVRAEAAPLGAKVASPKAGPEPPGA